MNILYFKSLWGMADGATLDEKLRRIAAAGYDGAEADLPRGADPGEWKALLAKHNLKWIAQIFAASASEFERELRRAAALQPLLVNAQSGRDRMTPEEAAAFFRAALDAERAAGVPVAHETHRSRCFYTPWTTARVLEALPDLRITADFSHWKCVCESRLGGMEDLLELAISRAIHIHGRIGFEEGPQVTDPRAPEFADLVEIYSAWWDRIREARLRDGSHRLTFTPEFGPPRYLVTLTYTRQPLVNLAEVNQWMADRQRARWSA